MRIRTGAGTEPAEIVAYGEKIGVLTRTVHPLGDVISVEGETAVLQSYFRNNVLHLFAAASWVALCFQNNRRMSRAGLLRLGRTIYPFVQEELFLPWDQDGFAAHLDATVDLFVAEGLLGREAPARLRHVAQGRKRPPREVGGLEQLVGVRHARERGRAGRVELAPERGFDHRPVREQQAAARDQVAVHDRQAVAVVQRQGRRGTVVGGQPQVVGDAPRVAQHVRAREAHELGRTGRTRGAREQRELGVERVPAARAAVLDVGRRAIRPGPSGVCSYARV